MSPDDNSPSGGATQAPAERNQRRHRGGNRGGNRGGRQMNNRDTPQQRPSMKKFVGKEDGLGEEFVYQLTSGNEASDQYAKTTEEIIRFTSTKYKQGGDVDAFPRRWHQTRALTMPPAPAAGADDAEVQVWKMRVNMVLVWEALLDSNLETAYALHQGAVQQGNPGEGGSP